MMTPEHQERMAHALELIEGAQGLMLTAAKQLCPVAGGANEWTATCRMYDQIKKHWHRVERFRVKHTRP